MLWLQFCSYIQVLKDFICAERAGNWSLNLETVGKTLNFFAAIGHYNYAKRSRLYLQTMKDLPKKYPWLYDKFLNHRYHVVQRTECFWGIIHRS